MTRSLILACAFGLLACQVGTRLGEFEPAQGPQGVQAELQLEQETVKGELLAVQRHSLLILSEGRVMNVGFRAIERARFAQMGVRLYKGQEPSEDQRRALQLVSRFPQGVSPQLLDQLLLAYNQSAPEMITR